jgi:hypothetical protein
MSAALGEASPDYPAVSPLLRSSPRSWTGSLSKILDPVTDDDVLRGQGRAAEHAPETRDSASMLFRGVVSISPPTR